MNQDPDQKPFAKMPKKVGAYSILAMQTASCRSAIYLAENAAGEKVWLVALPNKIDHEYVLNFKRRLETLAQLKHDALPEIQDNRTRKNSHAFATIDYQPLTSLQERFEMERSDSTPMPALEALAIIREIASVLTVLHPAGLVHNNLDPQRIFYTENQSLLILDAAFPFIPVPEPDFEGMQIIRLPYASPEERAGKPIAARGNIYSLGVILYQLLAGHQPQLPTSEWDIFEYKALPRELPLKQVRAGLTPETYDLVRNCLWQKEWSRYDTMEQLIAAIDIASKVEEMGPEPVQGFFDLYKKWIMIAVPVVIILVLVIIFLLLRS